MNYLTFKTVLGSLLVGSLSSVAGAPCGTPATCGQPHVATPHTVDLSSLDAGDGSSLCNVCGSNEDCSVERVTIHPDGSKVPDSSGKTAIVSCTPREDPNCTAGRRPAAMELRASSEADVGSWLLLMSALELASVDAFRFLRRDLALHGAPKRLLHRASRAAREERGHARRALSLARQKMRPATKRALAASRATMLRVGAHQPVSMETLAIDNAVEGCVKETFAALVAHHQALTATDASIRSAMKRIAEEETRHAQLSWEIDAWATRRLSREERERVEAARRRAMRELVASPVPVFSEPSRATLGLPTPCHAAELARRLFVAA